MCVFVSVRVCVCVCVQATFHLVFLLLPPTSSTSPPSCDWVPGICWGANSRSFSHEIAMVQVGLRVPTPLAMRKGLSPASS